MGKLVSKLCENVELVNPESCTIEELADACVDSATRCAGLVPRQVASHTGMGMIQVAAKRLKVARDNLSDAAEILDRLA
jgi:hypothetical protein